MSAFPKQTDLGWRRRLRSRVLRWYDQNGRQLPWRQSSDPYRIWVSEIMLQQTTVAAVVPYFDRFIQHFPTVADLASAEQEQVLRQWEGLGYYSRARNLHQAAGIIQSEFQGEFPRAAEELQQLPGIGPYTAGAIASFAFNQPAGIVEANTLRLYSRLIELDIDPRGTTGQKTLWKFAHWIVSRKRSADFNQAVMDIGSEICRPTNPDCLKCPLMASCRAFEAGRQHDIPLEKAKPQITDVTEVAIAIRKGNRFLLRQHTPDERWTGLWDFVRFEITADTASQIQPPQKKPRQRTALLSGQQSLFGTTPEPSPLPLPPGLSAQTEDLTGVFVSHYEPIREIRHAVTRYRIRLLCLVSAWTQGRIRPASGYKWIHRKELSDLPLSTTARKFADQLESEPDRSALPEE